MQNATIKLKFKNLPPELQQIQIGNLFWFSAQTPEQVLRMSLSVRLEEFGKAPASAVISDFSVKKYASFLSGIRTSESFKSKIFEYQKKFDSFSEILKVLEHLPNPDGMFFYFWVDASLLFKGKESKVCAELSRLLVFAQKHELTCFFFSYGSDSEKILQKVMRYQLFFMGLTSLTNIKTHETFNLKFWRTYQSCFGGLLATLRITEDGTYELIKESEHGMISTAVDHGKVYSNAPKLKKFAELYENFHFLDDQKAMLQKASASTAATFIFNFEKVENGKELAEQIYNLRKSRGAELKLYVAFGKAGLRGEKGELFLSSGANLVFPFALHPQDIWQVIEATYESRYTHTLAPSFQSVKEHFSHITARGIFGLKDFKNFLNEEYSSGVNNQFSKGVLVCLEPIKDLTPAEALGSFHPKRTGDIGTVFGKHVLIYFSACQLPALERSFANAFGLPPDRIFSNYQTFSNAIEIRSFLSSLEASENNSQPLQVDVRPINRSGSDHLTAKEYLFSLKDYLKGNPVRPEPSAAYLSEEGISADQVNYESEGLIKPSEINMIPECVLKVTQSHSFELPNGYFVERSRQ